MGYKIQVFDDFNQFNQDKNCICLEHCQLDEGWEDWRWNEESKNCGIRRRTRKIKVQPQHGGQSCEKKYPDEYIEEETELCDPGLIFFKYV